MFYGYDFNPRVRLPGSPTAASFSEQRIAFRPSDDALDSKLGLADDRGKVLGMYDLSAIEPMSQEMASVNKMVQASTTGKHQHGESVGQKVQRIGYLNHAGKLDVPAVFDDAADFSEQRATVIS